MWIQLSGDMTKATSGAVQIHLEDCRAGILQANNRTVEDALAKFNMTLDIDSFFAVDDESGNQTLTDIDLTCPICRPESNDNRQCCGNGRCLNSVCRCNAGKQRCSVSSFLDQFAALQSLIEQM